MRLISFALAGLLAGSLFAGTAAAQESETPPSVNWSFDGPFGTFDLASAQRGFQVYKEVCAACHSMDYLHYRDLSGIGLTEDQIKAIAASVTVPGPLDDNGQPTEVPGTPASMFKAPYPNETAAAAAFGGAAPPDQSLLVNARPDGANYIHALMGGYTDAPPGVKVPDGMYYNTYFPGHLLRMPPPLQNGQVTYADGTPATVDQMSKDVVTFLTWAANPEMVVRKRMGVHVILFLLILTGLTYAVKRKVWADVH